MLQLIKNENVVFHLQIKSNPLNTFVHNEVLQ